MSQTLTFCINLPEAHKAIEWYKNVFGAVVEMQHDDEATGKLYHANLRFGETLIFCCEELCILGVNSPRTLGGAHMSISIEVTNPDEVFAKAMESGAEEVSPVADQTWGMRSGTVRDPFGYKWSIFKPL